MLDDVTHGMFLATKPADPTRPVIDASGYAHRVLDTDTDTDIYESESWGYGASASPARRTCTWAIQDRVAAIELASLTADA